MLSSEMNSRDQQAAGIKVGPVRACVARVAVTW